jgi:YgiT-type zinc finger domain-containing protein
VDDFGQPHYGRCPCSGSYEQRYVEVRIASGSETIVVSDVPQGACPLCGSRVYKTAVLREVESLMRGAAVESS